VKKVLIVDDDETVRRLLSTTLAGGEYELLHERNGKHALETARRELPILILLDVSMPGLDGIEVCRQVKRDVTLRGTVIVILTANSKEAVRRTALAAGADLFLAKPFSPLQVLELIKRKMSATS
jgi:two-component system, OmpR family, phosphate regulon response regulator PhoB